jgi:dTDP-4-dehydrorhamnose reductase
MSMAARFDEGQNSKEPTGVFHVVAPDGASRADLADAVFAASLARGGPSARVRRIPASEYATLARRPQNSRLDASKLERVYGIRLPSWRAGVEACVERLIVGDTPGGETV